MPMKCILTAVALLWVATGGGCQHVVYVHESTVGINVNLSGDSGTAKFTLGYDDETFALVPRFTPLKEDGTQDTARAEAMSLVSVSNVDSVGLDELIFNHIVATGYAAQAVVKDAEGLKLMRKAVFGPTGN